MELTDSDFELVNAFHDGELDSHAAAAFEERLAAEPALRAALEEVSEISRALGALRPITSDAPDNNATRSAVFGGLTVARMAVAASLTSVFLAGATLLLPGKSELSPTPFDWHRLFVAQDYPRAYTNHATPAAHWIGNVPDLSSASLKLVDAAGSVGEEFYFHYSGVNGCRLTFGIHLEKPNVPADQPDLLVRNWSAREMHYSLFAVGMDRHRFEAIAKMLLQESETGSPGNDSLLAVREATRAAVPCA
jgi:hypothetical protein